MYGLSIKISDIEYGFEHNTLKTATASKRIAKRLSPIVNINKGLRYEADLKRFYKNFKTNKSADNLRCLIFDLKEFMVTL